MKYPDKPDLSMGCKKTIVWFIHLTGKGTLCAVPGLSDHLQGTKKIIKPRAAHSRAGQGGGGKHLSICYERPGSTSKHPIPIVASLSSF